VGSPHKPGPIEASLERFEAAVRDRPASGRRPAPLPRISPSQIEDPLVLARLHDAALFARAFPRNRKDVRTADAILRRIPSRMATLARRGTDLASLDDFRTVGIGGTSLTMDFSWGMARWLARRHGAAVSIAWDETEGAGGLAAALSRFLPFLPERSLADAGIDYETWLRAALPRGTRDGGLAFLLAQFDSDEEDDVRRAGSWDSLRLPIRWRLGMSSASRTLARLPVTRLFIDAGPLLSRREVSLASECEEWSVRVRRLPAAEGRAFLDVARAAVAVRYRELYAFTWGNPRDVVCADVGRGLSIWCCGLLPAHRLPLRGGYGFLIVRNGVPIGYGDAYALGDRLDLSFNVFYAFRDGESALAYARTVAFFGSFLGARSVSIDPYQIGRENEEAIESGAFWFYRKLGFRSADPAVEAVVRREEARNARRPGRRTPPATLRRIAGAPLLFDLPGPESLWSRVSLDRVGIAIQRRLAGSGLSPERFRRVSEKKVARALDLDASGHSPRVSRALRGLAPVLHLVPGLSRLGEDDKAALRALVRRKSAAREVLFVREMASSRLLAEALWR
jgi:hypothetical protein